MRNGVTHFRVPRRRAPRSPARSSPPSAGNAPAGTSTPARAAASDRRKNRISSYLGCRSELHALGHAAVANQVGAGDEAGPGAGQEHHRVGHLFRCGHAARGIAIQRLAVAVGIFPLHHVPHPTPNILASKRIFTPTSYGRI